MKKKLVIVILVIILILYIFFPFKFINVTNVLNLNCSNDGFTKYIDKEITLKVQGLNVQPLFGNEIMIGVISVDYNDQDYEYTNLNNHIINKDGSITIKRVIFPYDSDESEILIQTDNFKNVVICQIKDNKCLLEDSYVLSTFSTIEEVNDFVKIHYNK